MQAIQLHETGSPARLKLAALPDPVPGPGRVLIRVAAAGLNFADLSLIRGRYLMKPALPFVPGFEVSGVVAALGPDIDPARLPVGSRVAALTMAGGGYAELAVARTDHTISLPDSLSLEAGAAFPLQALTAYHVLKTVGRLAPGETVVVQATAGGVGTMSIQLARLFGAGLVIASAGGADKLPLARSLGADEVIDYQRENYPARVNEITECRGADLILESIGGQLLERSFECLAVLGRVVTFGNASGAQADLNGLWPRLRARSQALLGFSLATVLDKQDLRDASITAVLDYLAEGRLRIVVGRRYDLAEAAAGLAELESRRTVGKILLKVGAEQ